MSLRNQQPIDVIGPEGSGSGGGAARAAERVSAGEMVVMRSCVVAHG